MSSDLHNALVVLTAQWRAQSPADEKCVEQCLEEIKLTPPTDVQVLAVLVKERTRWLAHLPLPTPERDAALGIVVCALVASGAPFNAGSPEAELGVGLAKALNPSPEGSVSAASILLASANKTLPTAYMCLCPHVVACLLPTELDQVLGGRPTWNCREANQCLAQYFSVFQRGWGVLWALAQEDSELMFIMDPSGECPLPVDSFRDVLSMQQREAFDERVDVSLWCDRPVTQALWFSLFDAFYPCRATVATSFYETYAEVLAIDTVTGDPAWLDYLLAEDGDSFGDVEEAMAIRALAQTICVPYGKTPDPTVLAQALQRLGRGGYELHQEKFLYRLFHRFANGEQGLFDAAGGVPGVLLPLAHMAHDKSCRLLGLSTLMAHVAMDQVEDIVYRALEAALWSPRFDEMFTCLSPALRAEDQHLTRSLFGSAIDMGQTIESVAIKLADYTDPEIVGAVLLQKMAQAKPLCVRFGDPMRWPMPLVAWRQAMVDAEDDLEESVRVLRELDQGLEQALGDLQYPAPLRSRLEEACRLIRPAIAEERYRAQDRQAALENTPTGARSRLRPRS